MNRTKQQPAKKWLTKFSDHVDFNRFQRGVHLFNQDCILFFESSPIGFQAKLKEDKKDTYLVEASFILENNYPRMQDLQLSCSCSDSATICMHAICAMFYYVMNRDEMEDARQSSIDEKQVSKLLEIVEKDIKQSRNTLLTLPKENFWSFDESFNDVTAEIGHTLSQIIDEIHKYNK